MSAFRVGILDGILNSHILPTIVSRATSARRNFPRVAIIGDGMSGICMAITLQHFGFDTFTIYEKSVAPGGTA